MKADHKWLYPILPRCLAQPLGYNNAWICISLLTYIGT